MSGGVANVVLLRGLSREARHWGALPQQLSARCAGVRVACLDLSGNGALANLPSPWRIADYVEACRRQSDAQGLGGPLHLVALSLGGMVALDWAQHHPDQVASCVLINTSLRPLAPWYWRLRPRAWPTLARALAAREVEVREREVLRLTSRRYPPGSEAGAAIERNWTALQREAPVSRANALRQLLAAARYRCAGPPRAPLLLLASTQDALVDVRCSRALAAQWGCPLHEHPDAGHDLALDAPDWLIARVAAWLALAG